MGCLIFVDYHANNKATYHQTCNEEEQSYYQENVNDSMDDWHS